MLVDSHCHLDFPDFAGRLPQLLARMGEAGVTHALCAGVSLEKFPDILALALAHEQIVCSVGVHPDGQGGLEPGVADLVRLAGHPRVVAIGETGLDYYRLTGDLEWQRDRFRVHIRAARECGKPLIVHSREAPADTLKILREERAAEVGGVFHCFTESWDTAEAALDMGFHVSFSGIVTFKNAAELREVARKVPAERLLVETDAPYLAPVPHRGRMNEPAYVRHVAAHLAETRETGFDELARQTTDNFFRLFGIPG